jgi:hypothetical protein
MLLYTRQINNERKLTMKDLSEYRILNKARLYREFKEKYNYPNMQITSYRRVLYGESTYLGKGRSPYIADMFKFFSEKLDKKFIDIAYDLLDSEFFGRKNTFLDVIIAEKGITKDLLGSDAEALDNIRLCDLNDDNRRIYEEVLTKVKE